VNIAPDLVLIPTGTSIGVTIHSPTFTFLIFSENPYTSSSPSATINSL